LNIGPQPENAREILSNFDSIMPAVGTSTEEGIEFPTRRGDNVAEDQNHEPV